jgi:hypothetical protein
MGAFIMSALDNGMSMMDVATFWQYIVKGAILLLAVWMDSATKRAVRACEECPNSLRYRQLTHKTLENSGIGRYCMARDQEQHYV